MNTIPKTLMSGLAASAPRALSAGARWPSAKGGELDAGGRGSSFRQRAPSTAWLTVLSVWCPPCGPEVKLATGSASLCAVGASSGPKFLLGGIDTT